MKLDKNYKVRVTPEQSRQIQKLLFDCGFQWAMTGQTIHSDREIILIEPDKLRLLNGAKSTLKFYIEIAADDLIALLTDLSKSAEQPPQVAKPRFSVGEKVYFSTDPDIKIVSDVNNDNTVRFFGEFGWADSNHCCPATQENYEKLCSLFEGIDFEQPPKPLTGSDLARAMLDKGWKYVPCYVHDVSDDEAMNRKHYVLVKKETPKSGYNFSGTGANDWKYAVPIDPRTGEPLTEAVLDE